MSAAPTLTVVVPTLNEELRLPRLLEALHSQTRPPEAIIVADAGSTDETAVIATEAGCLVVKGGMPARGRNAGAAAAETDLVFFFDADVVPPAAFLEESLAEFTRRELDIATALIAPLERDPRYDLACDVTNLYMLVVQRVSPRAPGFCILVKRDLHERVGGFDETVVMAEDHEYAYRASQLGKFRVLECMPLPVSMRRIAKEGLVQLAFKYLYTEMYAMTGRPIHSVPFEYEFGSFEEEGAEPVLDVSIVREQLGSVAEAMATMTAPARERLIALGQLDLSPRRFEERLAELPSTDVAQLTTYVRRRLRVFPRRAMRRARDVRDFLWLRTPGDRG